MFIGPKISKVFVSRWHALFWSAGVLLTAYCSIPAPSEEGSSAVDPTLNAAVGLVVPNAGSDSDSHVSPWAKASPAPPVGK